MPTAIPKAQMESANPRDYIKLLMENERRIYAYLQTLLGNSADAEDVLQETSIVMWDKFSEFDQDGGNFLAWAFKIAYFNAQNFRRKQGRSLVVYSDATVESIAEKTAGMLGELDRRHELLVGCIEKLSDPDRLLLRLRYELDSTVEVAAEKSGRTVQAVYRALSRIRARLSDCINRGLIARESS